MEHMREDDHHVVHDFMSYLIDNLVVIAILLFKYDFYVVLD